MWLSYEPNKFEKEEEEEDKEIASVLSQTLQLADNSVTNPLHTRQKSEHRANRLVGGAVSAGVGGVWDDGGGRQGGHEEARSGGVVTSARTARAGESE